LSKNNPLLSAAKSKKSRIPVLNVVIVPARDGGRDWARTSDLPLIKRLL
jgi:hypothetical protein